MLLHNMKDIVPKCVSLMHPSFHQLYNSEVSLYIYQVSFCNNTFKQSVTARETYLEKRLPEQIIFPVL